MNKKIKIVLLVIVLLIIALIIGFYYWKSIAHEYVCVIEKIESDELVVKEFSTKTQEFLDKYNRSLSQYRFSIKGAAIKNSKGKKINVSDLKIGDKIHIINIYKKPDNVPDIAFRVETLDNVIFIQVLED